MSHHILIYATIFSIGLGAQTLRTPPNETPTPSLKEDAHVPPPNPQPDTDQGHAMIGKPLPPFNLESSEGRRVSAEDLRGSWTVLYAYPKDNTPGCTQEACDFRDNWARLTELGVKVYGISPDSLKSHAGFIEKHELPFPLLSDPDKTLLTPLGAFGKKVMYGKESEGVIRSTFLVDPQGIVRHVWPKVSVKGHVSEVLAQLAVL